MLPSPKPLRHSRSLSPSYRSLTLLSLASSQLRGSTPRPHLLTHDIGHSKQLHTEFLHFEVARFNYAYNAIIERPGLAKFMATLHYTYMMLNMSVPQGVVTVKDDFWASKECYRGAIQMALASNTSVVQK
jgi:hypothetical protein